jgi:hypothetical protein
MAKLSMIGSMLALVMACGGDADADSEMAGTPDPEVAPDTMIRSLTDADRDALCAWADALIAEQSWDAEQVCTNEGLRLGTCETTKEQCLGEVGDNAALYYFRERTCGLRNAVDASCNATVADLLSCTRDYVDTVARLLERVESCASNGGRASPVFVPSSCEETDYFRTCRGVLL